MSSIGVMQNLSGDPAVFSCFEGEPETILKDRLKGLETESGDRDTDDELFV